jgi:3-deoxy-D-manno-octulosonic-acid transferase
VGDSSFVKDLAERFALRLYEALCTVLIPLIWLRAYFRSQTEPLYATNISERFGFYSETTPPPNTDSVLWIHSVSLGETRSAEILLGQLRTVFPLARILLTHGTSTGRQAGAALLKDGDVQVWQPWDTRAVVSRFLRRFQPSLCILIETEVWPLWIQTLKAAQIPTILVNARLSPRSFRLARRLKHLSEPTYRGLSLVLAQTEDDAERFRALGTPKIVTTGNLKFDLPPNQAQQERGRDWRSRQVKPIVMLASTRDGEEIAWMDLLVRMKPTATSVQWLVVPRQPRRFLLVSQLLRDRGWAVSHRSQWNDEGPPDTTAANGTIWLGDTTGEMQTYYSMASIAWLGGSFVAHGGQNLIEAAMCGCPVIMGPHTFNFTQAAAFAQQTQAAMAVPSMEVAWKETQRLLLAPEAYAAMVKGTERLVSLGRGATLRTVSALL